jgi:hypothetical protein
MTRLAGYLLIAVFFFQTSSTLLTLSYFYFNRSFIAENKCVNRFDAIPVCKGQCYLDKQLKKEEQSKESLPELKQFEFLLFSNHPLKPQVPGLFQIERSKPCVFISCYSGHLHSRGVFHPPCTIS